LVQNFLDNKDLLKLNRDLRIKVSYLRLFNVH